MCKNQEKSSSGSYSDNGFTLLESLIVIVIIGILSAIAVPSWLSFLETRRLEAAQTQIYIGLRQAQSQAIKKKVDWQFSIRYKNQRVQWATHPSKSNPEHADWQRLDSGIILSPETTLHPSNGIRKMEFDFRGNVRKPPLGRVTLASENGINAKRCVYISTILGAMRKDKDNRC